jgi:hypothetical protein
MGLPGKLGDIISGRVHLENKLLGAWLFSILQQAKPLLPNLAGMLVSAWSVPMVYLARVLLFKEHEVAGQPFPGVNPVKRLRSQLTAEKMHGVGGLFFDHCMLNFEASPSLVELVRQSTEVDVDTEVAHAISLVNGGDWALEFYNDRKDIFLESRLGTDEYFMDLSSRYWDDMVRHVYLNLLGLPFLMEEKGPPKPEERNFIKNAFGDQCTVFLGTFTGGWKWQLAQRGARS